MALETIEPPVPPQSSTQPPSTPPSPPPASPPATPEPPKTDDNPFSEVWKQAEAHVAKIDGAKPTTKGAPEPPADPVRKEEPKVPEAKVDPKAKPAEKPKSEAHKLRDLADAANAELVTFKDNYAKLEAKYKELETKGQDTSNVLARMAQVEKERDDALKERESIAAKLKAVDITKDPEFKKKFEDRFNKEAGSADRLLSTLAVLDADGNPTAEANWKRDFQPLYYMHKEPAKALAQMRQQFGPDATSLLFPKLQKLWEIDEERREAISEAEAKAAETAQAEQAQASTRKQQLDALWVQTNRELAENNPDFRLDPTDKELAQVRDESLRIFDGKPANDTQRLIKNAHIRQMVGMSAVQKMQIARLTHENASLKAELESLKNPTPPPSKRTSSGAPATEPDEDWVTRAKRELVP